MISSERVLRAGGGPLEPSPILHQTQVQGDWKLSSCSSGHAGTPDIRLALLSAGELFGGVERQLLDLCRYGRRRQGAYPLLIVFHERELARQARALGVEPVVLCGRHRYDPLLVRHLARTLEAAGVAVVHAHGYKAAISCALARRRAAFAVVKTEHGWPEPVGAHPVVWGKSRLNHVLGTWATHSVAQAVTYVSEDIARHYDRAHHGLRRSVIRNGIDPLDRCAFARPPDMEREVVHLGIVGRVTRVKGISFALRALASHDVPSCVRLNVLGTGPEEAALRQEAEVLGVAGRVRFLGFRTDVFEFMAHLDALLMPSLYEGLPYTLLEAMSLGIPIVASRVGGLSEVLEDGETALLVPAGDVARLRAAILRIVNDSSLGRALGAAAAAAQRRRHTLDQMGDRYWQVYEECAASQARNGVYVG